MVYVVRILEKFSNNAKIDLGETPNAETLKAFAEGDKMLEEGTGKRYSGSTEDFFSSLLTEDVC